MKLHILSDLHTEFGDYRLATQDFDVLILAGDIGTGLKGIKYIQELKVEKPIIYLAGNHEYYGGALPHLTKKIREATINTNIHFLDRDEFIHDGVRFLGATLWTDLNLNSDLAFSEYHAQTGMNDYRKIRISPAFQRATPKDFIAEHRKGTQWLTNKLSEEFNGPTVVITRHAPHRDSMKGAKDDKADILAPCYASDLTRFMGEKVKLWISGHTHVPVDYDINGTRILSNPRGYRGEGVDMVPPDLILN